MLNDKQILIFKDENENKISVQKFADSVKLCKDKLLIKKYTIVQKPIKKQSVLMIAAKTSERSGNKFGVGKVIAIAKNIQENKEQQISIDDCVLFNHWNHCIEFTIENTTYFIIKLEDLHAVVNTQVYTDEDSDEKNS
jgi:co-chaperonin GroES (HSP10)